MKNLMITCGLIFLIGSLFAGTTEYFPGELIVQIRGDFRQPQLIEESLERLRVDHENYDLRIERQLSRRVRIYLLAFDTARVSTADMLTIVKKHPVIEEAQFNHKVELRQTFPDDPLFDQQWALHNTGQSGGTPGADIAATYAWEIATGGVTADGREIVVAVIDNGFSLTHPDINYWKNENEIPGNGIDNDGNGYIDDYDGWNAYNNNGTIPVATHGTHVSGIIAAFGNNDLGVSGVNWGAKIMPIAGSSSNEAVVVAAYAYAHDMRSLYNETDGALGAYVVSTNSSFGVNYGNPDNYPLWGAMYDAMGEVGILSAAATMNINANVDVVGDVPTAFPSPYLLGVTNTTRNDTKNTSAAYGVETIDLGAPGTQILSTVPGNAYNNSTGTSMASPHVAGAVALMYAAAPASLLDLYEDDPAGLALVFKDILLQSVDVIPALENITVSGGRLNVHNALQMVLDYDYQPEEPAPYNLIAEYDGNEVVLTWQEQDYRSPHYYIVQRNEEVIHTGHLANMTYTDDTPVRGWYYEYQVYAGYLDPPGVSLPSNTASLTLPPAAPHLYLPEDGAIVPYTGVTLEWEEVYGFDYYTICVALDEDFQDYFLIPINLQATTLPLPNLTPETTLFWKVSATNPGGTSEYAEIFSFTTEPLTSVDDQIAELRTGFTAIFPNPFNLQQNTRSGGLQIDLALARDSYTTLTIFNIKGQTIREILASHLTRGEHTLYWNGRDTSGREVGSGVYFIRMQSEEHREISRILLIK